MNADKEEEAKMDKNKWKEAMNAKYGASRSMNKDYDTSYPGNRYPYHYMDTDGSLISIRRMTQDELRDGAAQCIAEGLGLGAPKACIHIDQTEDNDPDLVGHAYRPFSDTTIVIVERDYMVAWIHYCEKAFSASRFAEAVEQVEIPIIAAMDDAED